MCLGKRLISSPPPGRRNTEMPAAVKFLGQLPPGGGLPKKKCVCLVTVHTHLSLQTHAVSDASVAIRSF